MPTDLTPFDRPFSDDDRTVTEEVWDTARAVGEELSDFGQTAADIVGDAKYTAKTGFDMAGEAVRDQMEDLPSSPAGYGKALDLNGMIDDARSLAKENPIAMLCLAFGGGVLVGTILASHKEKRGTQGYTYRGKGTGTGQANSQADSTLDNIKQTLIGVATTKIKEIMDDIIPGAVKPGGNKEKAKSTPPWDTLVPEDSPQETAPIR
jgi:hypothetical protein